MKKILAINEENSFIATALAEHLESNDIKVKMVSLNVAQIAEYQNEDIDAVIVFVSDLNHPPKEVTYLKDFINEKRVPVFEIIILDLPDVILPLPNIVGIYRRPIMVTDVAKNICEYLLAHEGKQRKEILVVDDSGVVLRSLKEWLGEKYQVAMANSGAMAMKYLALHHPDLIILDYEMPVVNGAQVLGMIRTEAEYEDIPVIFLTSKNDRATVMEVQQYKISGYLLKTAKPEEIIAQIDRFFEKQEMK